MSQPATIWSGSTRYVSQEVVVDGGVKELWLPIGCQFPTHALYTWKVKRDINSGKYFFVNMDGLGKKWRLPDVFDPSVEAEIAAFAQQRGIEMPMVTPSTTTASGRQQRHDRRDDGESTGTSSATSSADAAERVNIMNGAGRSKRQDDDDFLFESSPTHIMSPPAAAAASHKKAYGTSEDWQALSPQKQKMEDLERALSAKANRLVIAQNEEVDEERDRHHHHHHHAAPQHSAQRYFLDDNNAREARKGQEHVMDAAEDYKAQLLEEFSPKRGSSKKQSDRKKATPDDSASTIDVTGTSTAATSDVEAQNRLLSTQLELSKEHKQLLAEQVEQEKWLSSSRERLSEDRQAFDHDYSKHMRELDALQQEQSRRLADELDDVKIRNSPSPTRSDRSPDAASGVMALAPNNSSSSVASHQQDAGGEKGDSRVVLLAMQQLEHERKSSDRLQKSLEEKDALLLRYKLADVEREKRMVTVRMRMLEALAAHTRQHSILEREEGIAQQERLIEYQKQRRRERPAAEGGDEGEEQEGGNYSPSGRYIPPHPLMQDAEDW